jgi:hypothetical protein
MGWAFENLVAIFFAPCVLCSLLKVIVSFSCPL